MALGSLMLLGAARSWRIGPHGCRRSDDGDPTGRSGRLRQLRTFISPSKAPGRDHGTPDVLTTVFGFSTTASSSAAALSQNSTEVQRWH